MIHECMVFHLIHPTASCWTTEQGASHAADQKQRVLQHVPSVYSLSCVNKLVIGFYTCIFLIGCCTSFISLV